MNRKAKVLIATAIALLTLAICIQWQRVVGLVRGEAFFQGRPTSYWRELIQDDAADGKLSVRTRQAFQSKPAGMPVLLECLEDSDANVRWGSLEIMPNCTISIQKEVQCYCSVLHDDDEFVRLYAIYRLKGLRREAFSAVSDLVARLNKSDAKTRNALIHALWEIDPLTALREAGWRRFESDEWEFNVELPGTVEKKVFDPATSEYASITYSFQASQGVSRFGIFVSEHPGGILSDLPLNERYKVIGENSAKKLNGKITESRMIENDGLVGHEQIVDVKRDMRIISRVFIVGNRMYVLNWGVQRVDFSRNAASHFFDTFELTSW